MLGCITLPFRLALLALLLVGAYLGWRNRDRIAEMLGVRPTVAVAPESRGRPTGRGLARAIEKVDSLNGWRADSIVLSAGEMASLIGAGLPAVVRRDIDSLQVELLEGAIRVRGKIRTEGLPREVLGPFAGASCPSPSTSPTVRTNCATVQPCERSKLEVHLLMVPKPGPGLSARAT